ncbi:MAG: HNH endonuclease [Micrococcales bacterium]|nr:HNH endonuclease [Micrococcales bacterium]
MSKLKNSVPCRICGELFVPGGAITQHERACDPNKKRRRRSRYRDTFFANNGPGPYTCFFNCGELLEFEYVVVHHVDADHSNDTPENLVPAHRACHNGYHFAELWKTNKEMLLSSELRGHRKPHSDKTKNKMSIDAKLRGTAPSAHARERAKEVNTGSKRNAETRLKMSEYAANRTAEHQQKLNDALRNRVVSEESRLRMSKSAKARTDRKKSSEGGGAV